MPAPAQPTTDGASNYCSAAAGNTSIRHGLTADESNFITVLSIQSLLAQFANSQVGADFVSGSFNCKVDPKLLARIDDLRWSLFPRWQSGGFQAAAVSSLRAAQHWNLLVSKSYQLLLTYIDAVSE